MRKLWGYAMEILFVPRCISCGSYTSQIDGKPQLVCENCLANIPIYKAIAYSPKFSLIAISSYENDTVKKLLHILKYRRFLAAADSIERLVDKFISEVDIRKVLPDDSVIVPMPLHKKRLRERGFNQAEIIAKIISEKTSIPVENFLVKTADTKHQTTLKDRNERLQNVKGSITLLGNARVEGKTVILVDDVYTTGATMNEAANVIRKAKPKNIVAFVIAKTS